MPLSESHLPCGQHNKNHQRRPGRHFANTCLSHVGNLLRVEGLSRGALPLTWGFWWLPEGLQNPHYENPLLSPNTISHSISETELLRRSRHRIPSPPNSFILSAAYCLHLEGPPHLPGLQFLLFYHCAGSRSDLMSSCSLITKIVSVIITVYVYWLFPVYQAYDKGM